MSYPGERHSSGSVSAEFTPGHNERREGGGGENPVGGRLTMQQWSEVESAIGDGMNEEKNRLSFR